MALPVVKHPTYSTELKYHGKVKFRNYINKEHKALLTAVELGDNDTVFNTTLDIVNACSDIDANLLTEAELEYMFLQIYTKSVQNKVEGNYSCDNVVEREVETTNEDGEVTKESVIGECKTQFKVIIPIEDSFIQYPDNYEEKSLIVVDDTIDIKLKEPSASIKQTLSLKEGDEDIDVKYIYECVDFIHDKVSDEKITKESIDYEKEFVEWFGNLPPKAIEGIIEFIQDEPFLKYDYKVVCPSKDCKHEKTIEFRGIADFFG